MPRKPSRLVALAFVATLVGGCESTDSDSSIGAPVYYGSAFYDPWYHGDHDYDYDVVVTPPPGSRPPSGGGGGGGGDFRPRPEHPIVYPPGEQRPPRPSHQPASRPPSVSTRPAPSIPSAPRVAPRGGGRR